MILLKIASFLIFSVIFSQDLTFSELECGIYEAQGVVKINNQNDFVLSIKHKTFSPFELIILGGSINEKWEHLNTLARIRFYVPYPIKAKTPPYVFVQSFQKPDFSVIPQNHLRLIEKSPCGQRMYK